MATGQQGFDPDDFFDQRRLDRQRDQNLSDRQRSHQGQSLVGRLPFRPPQEDNTSDCTSAA